MIRKSIVLMMWVIVGCVHPARGPASDAQAWKREGPCTILNANFPRDTRDQPGREVFAAMDPVTKTKFMTIHPEGCRTMKFRVGKEIGIVQDSPATSECEVYGGEIVSKTEVKGLTKVYRWTDPNTRMAFNALEDARCADQGFTRDDDPLGYGNP